MAENMKYHGEKFARGALIAGGLSAVVWGILIIVLWWTL
jgi:hypothetical protein